MSDYEERVAQKIHEAHAFSKHEKGSRALNAELARAAISEMAKPTDQAVRRVAERLQLRFSWISWAQAKDMANIAISETQR